MTLDQIEEHYVGAHAAGLDVARLHSGDLSIYSALAEQLRRLERHAIPYTLTPGVPAFAAAAAVLGRELTAPGIAQSVVLTRMPGRASRMPDAERLTTFAASGATLAIHLAIQAMDSIVEELVPHYGSDCPVAVVMRASWPDERVLRGNLGTIRALLAAEPMERTALVFVGGHWSPRISKTAPCIRPGTTGAFATPMRPDDRFHRPQPSAGRAARRISGICRRGGLVGRCRTGRSGLADPGCAGGTDPSRCAGS
jgi:precorrin-4 methylase